MARKRIYAWIAPIGAGKGTQCGLLSERRGIAHIVMSNLLRERREVDDEIGRHIKTTMKAGELVRDVVTIQVLKEYMERHNIEEFSLDGFPRSKAQMQALIALKAYFDVFVFLLQVSDETSVKQAAGRRAEQIRQNEILVAQGQEPLPLREDDDPVIVPERLKIYRRNESDMLNLAALELPGNVYVVSGETSVEDEKASIEEVHQRILSTDPFQVLV